MKVQNEGRERAILLGSLLRRVPYLRSHASYLLEYVIADRRFLIPIMNDQGFRHFWRFEKETFAILKALHIQSPGAFIDVGANIGQTLLKIKAIAPDVEYVGFEPSPACCAYLDLLIRENSLSHCTVFPVGASDKKGMLRLFYNHSTDAAATTVQGFWTGPNAKYHSRSILVDRGDAVVQEINPVKVGMIKIDVEGAELEALSGLRSTIANYGPPIIIEVLPASCDLTTDRADILNGVALRLSRIKQLVALLDAMRLTSYQMRPDGTLLETREFDSKEFDPGLTNYLLVARSSSLDLSRLSADFRRELTSFD
jgi:FkbM family methyltransferase